MATWRKGAAGALAILLVSTAHAELQEVQVGGQLTIAGRYWSEEWFDTGALAGGLRGPNQVRYGGFSSLASRSIGDAFAAGPNLILPLFPFSRGLAGTLKFDDGGHSVATVEQRTRLNVLAKFSGGVNAFIEVDSFEQWGENFRSDYITGVDRRARSDSDVEIFQAYIEMNEMWGQPLRVRIGRQEIILGGGWLVSNNGAGLNFAGTSFDGFKLDYVRGDWGFQAFATKLVETSPIEEDGDVDFYGAYLTYNLPPPEDFSYFVRFDAYYLLLRDARSREQNPFLFQGASPFGQVGIFSTTAHSPGTELLERLTGVDSIGPTTMHTVGLRSTGTYDPGRLGFLDWDIEAAYQFGDAGALAHVQIPITNALISGTPLPFFRFRYVDDSPKFNNLAVNVQVGFTVTDWRFQPRFYAGYAYFEGNDRSDINFFERINPFAVRNATVSFNRLFSDWEYSNFLDIDGGLSNVWVGTLGVEAQLTEKIRATAEVSHFEVVDPFRRPVYSSPLLAGFVGPGTISLLSPVTRRSHDDLGWELGLSATYQYSEDLLFGAGYSHFFAGKGMRDGNLIDLNGLGIAGGLNDSDADYVYFYTDIKF